MDETPAESGISTARQITPIDWPQMAEVVRNEIKQSSLLQDLISEGRDALLARVRAEVEEVAKFRRRRSELEYRPWNDLHEKASSGLSAHVDGMTQLWDSILQLELNNIDRRARCFAIHAGAGFIRRALESWLPRFKALMQIDALDRDDMESHESGILKCELWRAEQIKYHVVRNALAAPFGDKLTERVRNLKASGGWWNKPEEVVVEPILADLQLIVDHTDQLLSRCATDSVANALSTLRSTALGQFWQDACDRRDVDPDGALTSARTFLESVCKHILCDRQVTFDPSLDLSPLINLVLKSLRVSPDAQAQRSIQKIGQGAISMVTGIGDIRNRLGDSHGKGPTEAHAAPYHARFAVDLAGLLAEFLIAAHDQLNTRP
ncbi:MAG: abortive infection family protein [Tepidisphaeraceae bacterium]